MIRPNTTAGWAPGVLATANIQVNTAISTGLAASCSQWYSDSQVNMGFLVFYGGTDGLVHEVTWHEGNNSWTDGFTFPGTNGYAGFDTRLVNYTLSIVLVNLLGCLEVWWRDFNPANISTSVWNKGNLISIKHCSNTELLHYPQVQQVMSRCGLILLYTTIGGVHIMLNTSTTPLPPPL